MTKRTRFLVMGGAAVLVLFATAVWFFFFRDDAPDAVSLDAAAGSVTSTSAGGQAATLDGTWTIDTTVGDGVVENSSFVGYRVQEELANVGAKTAVGRTNSLSGTFTFQGTTLSAADIDVDMTALESDSSGRDRQMRTQALETDTFPDATFTLTAPVDLGAVPETGTPFSVEATGDLTVHGVTRPVTVPIEGQLLGDSVVVIGRIDILFSDYDIDSPRAALVLSVEDQGEMEFQLFLTRT